MAPTRSDRGTLRLAAGLAVGLVVGLVGVLLQPDLLRTSLPLTLLVAGAVVAAIAGLALARWSIRIEEARDDAVRLSAEAAERETTATREIARLVADEKARIRELSEAAQQQAATAEILRVIAGSRADVQPVFDAIARSAARLCDGLFSTVVRVQGGRIELVARHGFAGDAAEAMRQAFPAALDAVLPSAQAIRVRDVVHVADTDASPYREFARARGYRSIVSVPMLREGEAIGAIAVGRREPAAFSPQQISLIQAFAAQAIIAIENVRLFQELGTRNRDLTEALEQQTATAEILRIISGSPTDLTPVFEAILANATRLCEAHLGTLFRYDGAAFEAVAVSGATPAWAEFLRRGPIRPGPKTVLARILRDLGPVHVADITEESAYSERDPLRVAAVESERIRTLLQVPLLRQGALAGVLAIYRREVRAFSDKQIALLQTFAAQAVIAIENTRLFQELQDRNRDLTEALEQQTATSEILRAISSSPTDFQPVMDAVAENAARVCGAQNVIILRLEGGGMRLMSSYGRAPMSLARGAVMPVDRGSVSGRAMLDRRTIHVADILAEPEEEYPESVSRGRQNETRTVLAAPLLREGAALGALFAWRVEVRPFSSKQVRLLETFADQAVIAIENVRLFRELEARNRDLTEALEQQTATGEILRVISSSPTDVRPVFDAIARSAVALCGAMAGGVFRFDGELVHFVAQAGMSGDAVAAVRETFPRRPTADWGVGRAILNAAVSHIADVEEDPGIQKAIARTIGYRSFLSVPMMREERVVGAINVGRAEPGLFTETQVALLRTFADQAVIAIENVRLFTELGARNRELSEALERQTATSEVLKVISRSTFDLGPVLATLLENAARLCGADSGFINRFDGNVPRVAAEYRVPPEFAAYRQEVPARPGRGSVTGRVALERRTVHVPDVMADPEYGQSEAVRLAGFRTLLGVPMLRGGELLGVIAMWRTEARPFTENQIELVTTFADQAVIAIENVRLVTELQTRNRELSETLEQQTTTGDVLRVISRSPTDLNPVLDAVATSAARLCQAVDVLILSVDGDALRILSGRGPFSGVVPPGERIPIDRGSVVGRAVVDRRAVHVADLATESDEEFPSGKALQRRFGHHTMLATPLLREGLPIGVIAVFRTEVRPFSAKQVTLLETFADQAVIAIENVRLFTELEARNRETTEALEQQTATAEVLRVISSSPTDAQPVFEMIAERAARLCEADDAVVRRVEGEFLELVAAYRASGLGARRWLIHRAIPTGRAVLDRKTVHIHDVARDIRMTEISGEPPDPVLETAWTAWVRSLAQGRPTAGSAEAQALVHALGSVRGVHADIREFYIRVIESEIRTILAVPLIREETAIGTIAIRRREARPFSEKQIALVKTFADQAVIAIENVRLFRELRERTDELTQSVGELRALGEVGRAVGSTLDLETVLSTIVSRATQLSAATGGAVYEFDEPAQVFRLRAAQGFDEALIEALRAMQPRRGEGAVGRAGAERAPVQIPDIFVSGAYEGRLRPIIERAGFRAFLAVPLLREDTLVGALVVARRDAGSFPEETVNLLQTFATQSVLAIQNARLYRELEEKGRELEVASQHKGQFLANMSHELRTPLNAILGYTELILDQIYGEVPDRIREVLDRIDRSGRHLLGLINDVLDLSKIEAGQLLLTLADYSLQEVVHAVVTQVESLAAEKGLALRATVPSDLPAGRGDERRLTQVLLNLVGNAIKFTESGEVGIDVGIQDGAFVVAVRDTGPGIAPADQAKIFEEFQQADSSSTRKKGGTGLGLSIARRIVELHGGRLSVESVLGAGATFTFTVPVRVERQVGGA